MLLSNKIKQCRKQLGYTQEQFAKELNVSVMTIRRYESGVRIPDANLISTIAELANVDTGYLLDSKFDNYDEYKKDKEYTAFLLDDAINSSEEKLLLYDFRDTDEPKQTIVSEFLEHYKNHKNPWQYPNLSYGDYLKIFEYIDFLIHSNNQENKYFIDMQPNDENGDPISKEQWELHFAKKYKK